MGATKHICLEETELYYEKIIKYLIYGNVLKNNAYPLSVSAERVYQAISLANYAKSIDAAYLAHGSTGAGNDQVRFDLIFQLIAPEIEILSPTRDLELSREEEINDLKINGIDMDWNTSAYSINKGLWGTSIGGQETLTSHLPLPESAFYNQLTETKPVHIQIEFMQGEICSLNGNQMKPVECIQAIESMAGKFAIGRDMHVGDTIIGIKGRVAFEAAAAAVIIKTHHYLEKHTLSKWQLYHKDQISIWYGNFIHESQYFDPVMRNLEAFLKDSQKYVSGIVHIKLHPYRFEILGLESPHDLMNPEFGTYGEMNLAWSGSDVKGFTKILANQVRVFNKVNKIS